MVYLAQVGCAKHASQFGFAIFFPQLTRPRQSATSSDGTMDAVNGLHVAQLPEEMLKFVAEHCNGPETRFRLGRLIWRGQKIINTPHYVATTSRGAIPHLSGDTVQKHTQISAAYVALEDCTFPPSHVAVC